VVRKIHKEARDTLALPAKGVALCTPIHEWNDTIVELQITCKMSGMGAVFSLIKRKSLRNSVGAGAVKGWVGMLASPRVDL